MSNLNEKDLVSITEDGVLFWNENLYVETITDLNPVLITISLFNTSSRLYERKIYRIGFDKFNFDKVTISLLNSMRCYVNCGPDFKISYEYEYFDIDFGILEINVIGTKLLFQKVDLIIKALKYKKK